MIMFPESQGRVAFVFHSHLPWVLGHGVWPVGEEWLYQAYANSYIPLIHSLNRLGARGFRNVASVGFTPILSAQLDHPDTLKGLAAWLHNWQLRSLNLPLDHPLRSYELRKAQEILTIFDEHFSRGAAPRIRTLIDDEVIEFLGGPATHPFTPGLDPKIQEISLRAGLDDCVRRFGNSPSGMWVPECAYRPGQEEIYEKLGITHFMVDEPAVTSVGCISSIPYQLGNSKVNVIARDAQISDALWSHERGYPGSAPYRDFHFIHHEHGLKLSAVGDKENTHKRIYDPQAAGVQVEVDARNFIRELELALKAKRDRGEAHPSIVIGIDTELLGHWWHEGIAWFERVVELLPVASIATATLEQVTSKFHSRIDLPPSSWGSGKDWSVWTGDQVRDIVVLNGQSQDLVLEQLGSRTCTSAQLNQLMLQLSSDWAFMITRDSAAQYARDRILGHRNQLISGVDSDAAFPLISFSA